MKKLFNMVVCLLLVFIECYVFAGCTKNSNESIDIDDELTTVLVNALNIEDYFELDGYVGFMFNNSTGGMADPWADKIYCEGSGDSYIESFPNYKVNDCGAEKNLTLLDFCSTKNDYSNNNLKWKAIILKAKKNIIINTVYLRAFTENELFPSYVNLGLQFSVKEYNKHSNIYMHTKLDNINTYTLTSGQPNQSFYPRSTSNPNNEFNFYQIDISHEYYGNEIYEWNERIVSVKQNQLFCIEFKNVEQIVETYKSFYSFDTISDKINMDFVIDSINFSIKI